MEKRASDWSPDGRLLQYAEHFSGRYQTWLLLLFGDRKPVPFQRTEYGKAFGVFSPNGKWIAYISDESGKPEVYGRAFHETGAAVSAYGAGDIMAAIPTPVETNSKDATAVVNQAVGVK